MELRFIRNKMTGEKEVLITNSKDYNSGYGYIVISNVAINEAINRKVLEGVALGKGAYNIYYGLNPKGVNNRYYHTHLNPCMVVLVCCDRIDSKCKAYALMDYSVKQVCMLKNASMHMSNTEGKKFEAGRHVCLSGLSKNEPLPDGVTKLKMEAPLLAALSEGKIRCIRGLEVHHINAHWDMRMCSIACLTAEEHDKQNSQSHRLDVVINDWEELVAFINFVNSPQYFQLFR